jgi:hypothetical protein
MANLITILRKYIILRRVIKIEGDRLENGVRGMEI